LERRLAAILAADVVGYSRLMRADEEGTLARLKALRDELFDPAVADHRGRIVKTTGDGALVEFASAVDAVRCAAEVQRNLAVREAGAEDDAMALRIGVNLGDVIMDGGDIYGDGVNVAARLEGLAEPGGICISASIHEQIRHKLDLVCEDRGDQRVKNIAEPLRVYRVVLDRPEAASGGVETLSLPDKPSVAVLPFDNLSGDPEQDYLADGISEDLITALSRIRWFFVIARNSSFTYKGQAVDVTQVARELGVRYVLEGSVRKAGGRVRVTAQLIDAATGRHVWAERYDREIEDIFALQDEMTLTIVAALEPELGAAERERALSKPPESLDAWETYQRGLWHMWTFEKEANAEARRLFRHAVERDPNFAPAYAFQSYANYIDVVMGWSEAPDESLDAALAAAKTALARDERDAVAYFALGRVLMMRGEHDGSIAALETAITLNPSSAQAHHGLGFALALSGRLDVAKSNFEKAERLSPRDPLLWAFTITHALTSILSHDYEAAESWARKTMRIPRASGYWTHAILASALGNMGRLEEARAAADEALAQKPDLSLSYLKTTLPTKEEGGLEPYLAGLRQAGLPE
jgi:adenylate cyclase